MILVKPSYTIRAISRLALVEEAGRLCYKSEPAKTEEDSNRFIKKRITDAHESVLEHSMLSVQFICDRGVSHELVRHRLCAFSQESTRYCNYKGGVTFVIPPWLSGLRFDNQLDYYVNNGDTDASIWVLAMRAAEEAYLKLLEDKWPPQQARSVLPNSLKTELVMTANFREWRHIFKLRCAKSAHLQMRELMIPLCRDLQSKIPVIFDDIVLADDPMFKF